MGRKPNKYEDLLWMIGLMMFWFCITIAAALLYDNAVGRIAW